MRKTKKKFNSFDIEGIIGILRRCMNMFHVHTWVISAKNKKITCLLNTYDVWIRYTLHEANECKKKKIN